MAESLIHKNRAYIAMAIIIGITAGNYYLSGRARSNWVEISEYGFTFLHPPGLEVSKIGLDDEYVFDYTGRTPASQSSGMLNFNVDNDEYALTWATLEGDPSLEEVLDIYFHSLEVNAIRRDRGVEIEYDSLTFGEVNRHEAAYQTHMIKLGMPDMDDDLFARGLVVGWTCNESGVSYTFYLLHWSTATPPTISDAELLSRLNQYLDTVECH